MTFNELLTKYRAAAQNSTRLGNTFERVTKRWLQTDPLYRDKFANIWLWNEFPGRKSISKKDIGIDLVAYNKTTNQYWAIQCKCYYEGNQINKKDIDTFLSTSGLPFEIDGKKHKFSERLFIATTNQWSPHAEQILTKHQFNTIKIGLTDLESSPVDWKAIDQGTTITRASLQTKKLRPYQTEAVDKTITHFQTNDRGRLIMACGTGKTYTALKVAEQLTDHNGLILVMVPSIALVGQLMKEWYTDSLHHLKGVAVCSDPSAGRLQGDDLQTSLADLPIDATTDPQKVFQELNAFDQKKGLKVIFSTYHSVAVVSEIQARLRKNNPEYRQFDLIICDEAHRTTGTKIADAKETHWVKVHDNDFLAAKKRLYMTATPRLYAENTKKLAANKNIDLWSMDDLNHYGAEIHRVTFSDAVQRNDLVDYKVIILTLSEKDISPKLVAHMKKFYQAQNHRYETDDLIKLAGVYKAISKKFIFVPDKTTNQIISGIENDPLPMKRAVAFCSSISSSKLTTANLDELSNQSAKEGLLQKSGLQWVDADHIDGTMRASERAEKLSWLKQKTFKANETRIITNVRCLTEGVDVPSLDAVIFLSEKNSYIDIVQAVGRVMRQSQDKKYGYIVIPVVVDNDTDPKKAMDNSKRWKTVWAVLNALRAHDGRLDDVIEKLKINNSRPKNVLVTRAVPKKLLGVEDISHTIGSKELAQFKSLQKAVYGKIVEKVGDRKYWEEWATDVGEMARDIARTIEKRTSPEGVAKTTFNQFIEVMRNSINPSITEQQGREMMAQHVITKPIFNALFKDYQFSSSNPISVAMNEVIDLLEIEKDSEHQQKLKQFYEEAIKKIKGVDNPKGRQTVITELYEKFFKKVFPKQTEQLGIVYTPIEVVDFIIRSVNDISQKEFGLSLNDKDVSILDPFTGTGTFISRLLESGLITQENLPYKYKNEIWANEIVPLAYYFAAINIENIYHKLVNEKQYQPFQGICLTDTFQIGEEKGRFFLSQENSKRVEKQARSPIKIILGNPPYSVGQKSENDNAKNVKYDLVDNHIKTTYIQNSPADLNKKSLHDSYFKAFRWATDKLEDRGIICFVTNGGWLDGLSSVGFRNTIEKEFSQIYVFNLRGNKRIGNADFKNKQGGGVFSGVQISISITLLVKKTNKNSNSKATIYYHDIGDYKKRDEKLKIIEELKTFTHSSFQTTIQPNEQGDWINQRKNFPQSFIQLAHPRNSVDKNYFFVNQSLGISTNRDAWVHNSSKNELAKNLNKLIANYNDDLVRFSNEKNPDKKNLDNFLTNDFKKIKWDAKLKRLIKNQTKINFAENCLFQSFYRPFFRQNFYFNKQLNARTYKFPNFFPQPDSENLVICVRGKGKTKKFSPLITKFIPNLDLLSGARCYPLYIYENHANNNNQQRFLFTNKNNRTDGITDFILAKAESLYQKPVTKKDIFYYVYGLFHSPEYSATYHDTLHKENPQLPLLGNEKHFWAFSQAGRKLANLHLNFATHPKPEPVKVQIKTKNFQVTKMKFPSKEDKSTIIYNPFITISNIPDAAYKYQVDGQSAIEWVIKQQQIKTDKSSGIVNDPNKWAEEHNQPRYILDLLLSVITLSLETVKIVEKLPKVDFHKLT